jgi:hypothetical protein
VTRVLVGLCAVLAGCAVLQPGVDDIVSETVEVARAAAPQQKATLAQAQQAFAADPTPRRRVRLAALLVSLPAPLHDDARALELLEPLVEAASPEGRFAAFLAAQIAERQRIAREAEREAKERASERANAERERQNAEKERDKREEALRQQLEALRAIERGILEREERLRKKPAGKP